MDLGSAFGPCLVGHLGAASVDQSKAWVEGAGAVGGNGNGSRSWAAGWCPSPVSFLPIAGMALYLCCFSAGFGPMPWTLNAEIYPNWARSTGLPHSPNPSFTMEGNWRDGGGDGNELDGEPRHQPHLPHPGRGHHTRRFRVGVLCREDREGTMVGAFFLYAGITAVGFLLFYFLVPETKGKSMEDIQGLFEKPWFGSPAAQ